MNRSVDSNRISPNVPKFIQFSATFEHAAKSLVPPTPPSRDVAAVDTYDLAVGPLGGVGAEEADHGGDVAGIAEPPRRVGIHGALHPRLVLAGEEHVRRHGARRDAVRRDAGALELLRHGPHHRLHRRLGRRVRRVARRQRRDHRRGDGHDAAAAGEAVRRLAEAEERAAQVDGDGAVEVGGGGVRQVRVPVVEQAGVRHEDVRPGAEGRLGGVEEGADARLVGHVGLDGHGAGELRGERVGLGGAGRVPEDEARAERGQVRRDAAPDAARRARHDGHAAGEGLGRRLRRSGGGDCGGGGGGGHCPLDLGVISRCAALDCSGGDAEL
ncbi:Os07g0170016, partial [Oryza sativa Japonica Group]